MTRVMKYNSTVEINCHGNGSFQHRCAVSCVEREDIVENYETTHLEVTGHLSNT